MNNMSFRFGTKRFYDNEKFPYGFENSGNFSIPESQNLSLYGDTMQALESGEIDAIGSEEKHFLKVLQNPKKANSILERVWLKYINLARCSS